MIVSRVKFLKGWSSIKNLHEAPVTPQTTTVRPSNVTTTVTRGRGVDGTSSFTKWTPRAIMRIKTIWPNKTKYRRDRPSHTVFANLVWAIPECTLRLFFPSGNTCVEDWLTTGHRRDVWLLSAPDWKLIISDLPPVLSLSTFPNGRRGGERTRPA